MTKRKAPTTFWTRLWREFLEPILFAVVITQFVATLVGVQGASMMPNLRNGERVFVPKYETWLHKAGVGSFHRGDILVFKPPAEASSRSFFGLWTYRPFLIKRLIALPGDTVSVNEGVVTVNGKVLDGSWTTDYWQKQGCWDTDSSIANNAQSGDQGLVQTQKTFTVPAGHYFMMGDNRTANGSEDSRLFGPIPLRDIAGRAAAVVWPFVRKANADYDCNYAGPEPEKHVEFSGPSGLNLRILTRPAPFGTLPAKPEGGATGQQP
ncbi:signal peptidase I [Deinococcus pimensis]|uniref:signal peptidase I n=1 Tax=Deinococcus pimensis TaxID=309888 RepID=UPI0004881C93|nr:signal peptidase I [Deinococcus pimensis]